LSFFSKNDGTITNDSYDQDQMKFINHHLDKNNSKPFSVVVLLLKDGDFDYTHNEDDRKLVLDELSRRLASSPNETLIVDRKDWPYVYVPDKSGRDKITTFIENLPTF